MPGVIGKLKVGKRTVKILGCNRTLDKTCAHRANSGFHAALAHQTLQCLSNMLHVWKQCNENDWVTTVPVANQSKQVEGFSFFHVQGNCSAWCSAEQFYSRFQTEHMMMCKTSRSFQALQDSKFPKISKNSLAFPVWDLPKVSTTVAATKRPGNATPKETPFWEVKIWFAGRRWGQKISLLECGDSLNVWTFSLNFIERCGVWKMFDSLNSFTEGFPLCHWKNIVLHWAFFHSFRFLFGLSSFFVRNFFWAIFLLFSQKFWEFDRRMFFFDGLPSHQQNIGNFGAIHAKKYHSAENGRKSSPAQTRDVFCLSSLDLLKSSDFVRKSRTVSADTLSETPTKDYDNRAGTPRTKFAESLHILWCPTNVLYKFSGAFRHWPSHKACLLPKIPQRRLAFPDFQERTLWVPFSLLVVSKQSHRVFVKLTEFGAKLSEYVFSRQAPKFQKIRSNKAVTQNWFCQEMPIRRFGLTPGRLF